jgi:hypothetical protein
MRGHLVELGLRGFARDDHLGVGGDPDEVEDIAELSFGSREIRGMTLDALDLKDRVNLRGKRRWFIE